MSIEQIQAFLESRNSPLADKKLYQKYYLTYPLDMEIYNLVFLNGKLARESTPAEIIYYSNSLQPNANHRPNLVNPQILIVLLQLYYGLIEGSSTLYQNNLDNALNFMPVDSKKDYIVYQGFVNQLIGLASKLTEDFEYFRNSPEDDKPKTIIDGRIHFPKNAGAYALQKLFSKENELLNFYKLWLKFYKNFIGVLSFSPRFPVDGIGWYHYPGSPYHYPYEGPGTNTGGYAGADGTYAIDLNLSGNADDGKTVYAIEGGIVKQASKNSGWVLLEHLGYIRWKGRDYYKWYSGYLHMRDIPEYISINKSVKKGISIGKISGMGGGNPNAYSPHLHFAIYVGKIVTTDPNNVFLESVDPGPIAGYYGFTYGNLEDGGHIYNHYVDEYFTNQDHKFEKGGNNEDWFETSLYGFYDHMFYTHNTKTSGDNWGRWSHEEVIPETGEGYKIYVFIPRNNATTTNAIYKIYRNGTLVSTKSINQSAHYDSWAKLKKLGEYNFYKGDKIQVYLSDSTGEQADSKYVSYDTIKILKKEDVYLYQSIPISPSNLKAIAVSFSQINLSWQDNSSDEDGFKIERKIGISGTYSEIATVGVNVTSYSNTGLNANSSYYYRIRAYNSYGYSDYSNETSATTPSCPTPGMPSNPSPAHGATGVSSNANLEWSDCADATSYDVYFGTSSSPPKVGTVTSSFYNLGLLNYNTTYHWKIVAKNECGETHGSIWNFTTQSASATNLYYEDPSSLYSIDSNSLAETFIGDIGFTNVTDIAFNRSGELFGCTYNYLLYIDPDTGKGSIIGSIGFEINALAFNHTGILYGATIYGTLITIDTSTGKGSYVGSFGGGLISSGDLIFSPDGKLYATARYSYSSYHDYLVIIDASTGTATIIGNIGFNKVYGLAYDKNGNLYGFTNDFELLSIDTSTGSGVLLGYLDNDAWGGTSRVVKQYTLTINASEGGTTDPSPGTHIYDKETEVTITATPDSGYRFKEWSGDATGENNPIKIAMDSNKSIKANFIRQYTLTISSTSGGTTNPSPGTYTHDSGAEVGMKALQNSGFIFANWTGDVPQGQEKNNPLTVTMDSDKSIKANFTKLTTDDDKKNGCFIATACFGTPMAEEVRILRAFRDKYLLTNPIGRSLVKFYYSNSPKVAEFIRDKEQFRTIFRECLKPFIWVISKVVK